jgi:hypothetical protein
VESYKVALNGTAHAQQAIGEIIMTHAMMPKSAMSNSVAFQHVPRSMELAMHIISGWSMMRLAMMAYAITMDAANHHVPCLMELAVYNKSGRTMMRVAAIAYAITMDAANNHANRKLRLRIALPEMF